MATIICISGTLSYSKYITSDNTSGGASAGSFTASAAINGISALSFTNTAFWGGSAESDKIAMNALRQLKFSVNNYQTDSAGNKKVAEVRMRYNLVFSAPVVFASKLAFQVFNEHDVALLPQIVLADLLATTSDGTYDTSTSVDYNSQSVGDLEFKVDKSNTDGVETITATAESSGVKVTITTFTRNVDQSLLFRLWDVSSLTNSTNKTVSSESGSIKPPVTVNYKQTVDFYKISVTMPDFVLPASVATTVNHSIQLAPTSAIDDNQLGGSLVKVTGSSGNETYTSVNPDSTQIIKTLYGPSGDDNRFAIETLVETVKDSYYEDLTFSGDSTKTENSTVKVTGNIQNYKEGSTTSSQYSYQTSRDIALTDEEKSSIESGTQSESYSWNNFQFTTDGTTLYNSLLNGTKDFKNSSLNSFVAIATAGDYGTLFYVHKIPATQTGTKTESKMISKTLASKSEVTDTTITETMTCDSIGANGVITLKVTKETVEKVSENKVYEIVSNDTISTVTRSGYIYICFYDKYKENSTETEKAVVYPGGVYDTLYKVEIDSNGNVVTQTVDGKTRPVKESPEVTYRNQAMFYENNGTNYFGDENKDQFSKETDSKVVNEATSNVLYSEEKSTSTNTEYMKREITRRYEHSEIDVSKISQSTTSNGTTTEESTTEGSTTTEGGTTEGTTSTEGSTTEGSTTTETTNVYTSGAPLYMYKEEKEEDGKTYNKQQYYLSSSYSKNYPFYVDVIFKQILE